MDHDSVVKDWQQNAQSHDEENYEFLRSMKFRHYGFRPDDLAGKLHEQAFHIVECTRCANCCKTVDITFTKEDVSRIALHLGVTALEFIETYLEREQESGQYKGRQKPCSFLGGDDRCTIYEVRPLACRDYPHTNKKGFTFRTMLHANNALTCPAVFWIIEQMKRRAKGR